MEVCIEKAILRLLTLARALMLIYKCLRHWHFDLVVLRFRRVEKEKPLSCFAIVVVN